jgi:single-stranded-DNA-specific exonuclease
MNKNIQILQPDPGAVEKIRNILNCSPLIATILANRKIVSPTDVSRFFNPSLNNLRPPFSMKDMDAAVSRICTAVRNNEKILIFGDYDADGITATTILLEFLSSTGADVSYYIPHRIKEGYSLQASHISNVAIPSRIRLIITVDCGSKSHEAIAAAQKSGIDVIITDHHTISGTPPPALAVINPKQQECSAGFDDLAGVGVAFYLMICLRKYLRDTGFWRNRPEPNLRQFCDLVALGTVADVVPLVNENRILSKTGLELIGSGESRPGIRALIKACGISGNAVDTDDIAFRLAPRLNASGRMGHAKTAVTLLTTDDSETAKQISQSLNQMNQKRQEIEKKMFEEILEYLDQNPSLTRQCTLVLARAGWHEGVLGIVASKIVEKYFRPVILVSLKNGFGKGSGRSIPGVDLHAGLAACADDLVFFGGHAMAAGLKIRADHISQFQKNFEKSIRDAAAPGDFLQTLLIDAELNFNDISDGLVNDLEYLAPFGEGNPEPIFISRNVKVLSSKIVGRNHRRMVLGQENKGRMGRPVNAIHFNIDTAAPFYENLDQIAYRLRWNRWNGKKTIQIIIEDS